MQIKKILLSLEGERKRRDVYNYLSLPSQLTPLSHSVMDVKSINIKRHFLSGCGRRRNEPVVLPTLCMHPPPNSHTRPTHSVNTKCCVFEHAKSEELNLKPNFRNLCNLGKIESISEHCGSGLFLKYHS